MSSFGFLKAAKDSRIMTEMNKMNILVIILTMAVVALELTTFFVPFSPGKELDTCRGFRSLGSEPVLDGVDYCSLHQSMTGIAVASGGIALLMLVSAVITHEAGMVGNLKSFIELILTPAKMLNISACSLLLLGTVAAIVAFVLQSLTLDCNERDTSESYILSGVASVLFIIISVISCVSVFGRNMDYSPKKR